MRQTGIFLMGHIEMCVILLFIALFMGMVASRPMTQSEEQRQELYRQWPGVPDETLADAEVDNAYELFKFQTKKPQSKIDLGARH